MPRIEENINQNTTAPKRDILLRDDVEYTAQKTFTYLTIGLTALTVYASVVYLIVQQLKK